MIFSNVNTFENLEELEKIPKCVPLNDTDTKQNRKSKQLYNNERN